jgi:hypothetical protein
MAWILHCFRDGFIFWIAAFAASLFRHGIYDRSTIYAKSGNLFRQCLAGNERVHYQTALQSAAMQ